MEHKIEKFLTEQNIDYIWHLHGFEYELRLKAMNKKELEEKIKEYERDLYCMGDIPNNELNIEYINTKIDLIKELLKEK